MYVELGYHSEFCDRFLRQAIVNHDNLRQTAIADITRACRDCVCINQHSNLVSFKPWLSVRKAYKPSALYGAGAYVIFSREMRAIRSATDPKDVLLHLDIFVKQMENHIFDNKNARWSDMMDIGVSSIIMFEYVDECAQVAAGLGNEDVLLRCLRMLQHVVLCWRTNLPVAFDSHSSYLEGCISWWTGEKDAALERWKYTQKAGHRQKLLRVAAMASYKLGLAHRSKQEISQARKRLLNAGDKYHAAQCARVIKASDKDNVCSLLLPVVAISTRPIVSRRGVSIFNLKWMSTVCVGMLLAVSVAKWRTRSLQF